MPNINVQLIDKFGFVKHYFCVPSRYLNKEYINIKNDNMTILKYVISGDSLFTNSSIDGLIELLKEESESMGEIFSDMMIKILEISKKQRFKYIYIHKGFMYDLKKKPVTDMTIPFSDSFVDALSIVNVGKIPAHSIYNKNMLGKIVGFDGTSNDFKELVMSIVTIVYIELNFYTSSLEFVDENNKLIVNHKGSEIMCANLIDKEIKVTAKGRDRWISSLIKSIVENIMFNQSN